MIIRHKWTEEEDGILRAEYDSSRGAPQRLADRLGVSRRAVCCRVVALGIARRFFARWTEKDDDRLIALLGKYPVSRVCKIMGRSQNVVLGRMARKGMTTKYRDGWYTLQDVVEILHVGRAVLRRCMEEKKLIATYHNDRKPVRGGKSYYHIEESDLRTFIIKYRYELDGRRVDLPVLIEMLVNHKNPQLLYKRLE